MVWCPFRARICPGILAETAIYENSHELSRGMPKRFSRTRMILALVPVLCQSILGQLFASDQAAHVGLGV